jgi:hypothetical protein
MYARGAAYLNGTQFESFPSGTSTPNYAAKWDAALQRYVAWDQGALPATHSEIFSRFGTGAYPPCGLRKAGTNADFRLGLGSALLSDAYYAYDNGCFGDYWWDEYSVDLATGQAVRQAAGVDALASGVGYLGQPLGAAQRLLNPQSATANLINETAWVLKTSNGASATASQPPPATAVGVNITSPGTAAGDVILRYPVSIVAGQTYSLSFWAKADNGRMGTDLGRDIDVALVASGAPTISTHFITGAWKQYLVEFVAPVSSASATIQLRVGREGGTASFDHVGLYNAPSALLRRDFTNGIVLVNGGSQPQTVSLGGTFRKIKGTQDPVNDGSFLTSVTIQPRDAVILLRTQTYKVVWQAHATPAAMNAGGLYSVPLSFANGGTLTWSATPPNNVSVAYHWRNGSCPGTSTAVWNGTHTPITQDVAMGGTVTGLSVAIKAPPAAGTYCLQYDLIREGVTWFSWQGASMLQVTITVN